MAGGAGCIATLGWREQLPEPKTQPPVPAGEVPQGQSGRIPSMTSRPTLLRLMTCQSSSVGPIVTDRKQMTKGSVCAVHHSSATQSPYQEVENVRGNMQAPLETGMTSLDVIG